MIVALALLAATAVEPASARFEAELGPLDPAAYALPTVPDERNAALEIRRAVAESTFARGKNPSSDERSKLMTCEGRDSHRFRATVAANAESLDRLARAADLPGSDWSIDYARGIYASPPDLIGVVDLSRLAACDARTALEEGDAPRVLERLRSLERVARSLAQEPMPMCVLIAASVERTALAVVRDVAATPDADASFLRKVRDLLPRHDLDAAWHRSVAFDSAAMAAVARGIGGDTLAEAHLRAVLKGLRGEDPPPSSELAGLAIQLGNEQNRRARRTAEAGRTLRVLAGAALDLRLRALEGEAAYRLRDDAAQVEPFGGAPLRLETREDGSATLDAPAAREMADHLELTGVKEDAFVWRLPPPR